MIVLELEYENDLNLPRERIATLCLAISAPAAGS